jgi:hypothetical protein
VAEEDLVEVDLEDAPLAEAALHADGQDGLAQLAVEGPLVAEEALGDLLGDRAAALDDGAGAEVGEDGARRGRASRGRRG